LNTTVRFSGKGIVPDLRRNLKRGRTPDSLIEMIEIDDDEQVRAGRRADEVPALP
jgi:hypothetical protein